MAHKAYATLMVTVSESACTAHESGFVSAPVGAGDFALASAFGAAATGIEGFAANATDDGFGVADGGALGVPLPCCPSPARTIGAAMAAGAAFGAAGSGVEGCAIGAVLFCSPSPARTVSGGTAAAETEEVFGMAASGLEEEAGAIFGVGTASGVRAGSCSLASVGKDLPAC